MLVLLGLGKVFFEGYFVVCVIVVVWDESWLFVCVIVEFLVCLDCFKYLFLLWVDNFIFSNVEVNEEFVNDL